MSPRPRDAWVFSVRRFGEHVKWRVAAPLPPRASRVGSARARRPPTANAERKQQPCLYSARVEVLEVLVDLLLAERRGALVPRIAYGIALGADGEEDHREQMVDATADWLGRLRPPKGRPSREERIVCCGIVGLQVIQVAPRARPTRLRARLDGGGSGGGRLASCDQLFVELPAEIEITCRARDQWRIARSSAAINRAQRNQRPPSPAELEISGERLESREPAQSLEPAFERHVLILDRADGRVRLRHDHS